jgi:hypothetical protein
MKVDLIKFDFVSKIFLGNNLRLVFQNRHDLGDKKLLELDNVAGFIDVVDNKQLIWLRIDDNAGSYSLDLSIRLKRSEIKNFKEIFLFTDSECVNFSFRASAEQVTFRDWTENDKWLK